MYNEEILSIAITQCHNIVLNRGREKLNVVIINKKCKKESKISQEKIYYIKKSLKPFSKCQKRAALKMKGEHLI